MNYEPITLARILLESFALQVLLIAGAGAIIGWTGFGAALANAI